MKILLFFIDFRKKISIIKRVKSNGLVQPVIKKIYRIKYIYENTINSYKKFVNYFKNMKKIAT